MSTIQDKKSIEEIEIEAANHARRVVALKWASPKCEKAIAGAWEAGYVFACIDRTKAASESPSKIEAVVKTWMEWTQENFPKSGPKASLIHLQKEIKEVIEAIDSEYPTFISEEGIPLMEYADCLICLLTAAGKSGFTIQELFKAIENKININYKRKWIENPDNTYSHVK